MRLPRKSWDKTRTLHACVWCVLCDLMNYCVKNMHNMNDVYNMECYVLSDCVTPRFSVPPDWRIQTEFRGARPNWDSLPDFFFQS